MSETNCPNCGAPIDLREQACPYCGTPYSAPPGEVVELKQRIKCMQLQEASIKSADLIFKYLKNLYCGT